MAPTRSAPHHSCSSHQGRHQPVRSRGRDASNLPIPEVIASFAERFLVRWLTIARWHRDCV